jgi:D-serine deaminase-like pyridoxal phosphate-dependent protein
MARMDIPAAVLAELSSPALVVDLAAADRNIARARDIAAAAGVRLRPHLKAHKCTTLVRRQLATGGCVGITVQTVPEAVAAVRAGIDDVLVAAPVVDPAALRALGGLAEAGRISVVVDCVAHVTMLAAAVEGRAGRLGVLIELDVGSGRCGVPFGSPMLLDVAEACRREPRLDLRGVQAYEGHASLRDDPAVRETLVRQVAMQVARERARLESAGHPCEVVSGGGTGTLEASVAVHAHSEVQAGSYVLLDTAYEAAGVGFEIAVACVARCVSRRHATAAVLDAGLKALASDHGPSRVARPGWRILGLSDEHARVALPADDPLGVGDVVLIEPAHLDPTVNLYDRLHVWDAARGVIEEWPVDARRARPMWPV